MAKGRWLDALARRLLVADRTVCRPAPVQQNTSNETRSSRSPKKTAGQPPRA